MVQKRLSFLLSFTVEVDEETNKINVDNESISITPAQPEETKTIEYEHTINNTEAQYGILTFGHTLAKKLSIDRNKMELSVTIDGKPVYKNERLNDTTFTTHKTAIGRIDGFSSVFRRGKDSLLKEGQTIYVSFDAKKNLLSINTEQTTK